MEHAIKIPGAVRTGIQAACDDAFYFTDSPLEKVSAEYLLTVNVAKALAKLNSSFGCPYVIRLECGTRRFATACLPWSVRRPAANFMGFRNVLRRAVNAARNGRIDVAVFTGFGLGERPLCAIELKPFNPSSSTVIRDLKRNAEYFSLNGPTGNSQLPVAIFGALHSSKLADDPEENLLEVRRRYALWLQRLPNSDRYKAHIDVFTTSHQAEKFRVEHGTPDFGSDDNHHFIGAMVVFSAKDSN